MKYLSENQTKFLRDLIHYLPGMHEFVDYSRRNHTNTGERNGEVFNIFGDEWSFLLFPENEGSKTLPVVHVGISENSNSATFAPAETLSTSLMDYDIEEIAQYIYNFYFKS